MLKIEDHANSLINLITLDKTNYSRIEVLCFLAYLHRTLASSVHSRIESLSIDWKSPAWMESEKRSSELSFKVGRAEIAERRMKPLTIVPNFDELEDGK